MKFHPDYSNRLLTSQGNIFPTHTPPRLPLSPQFSNLFSKDMRFLMLTGGSPTLKPTP